MHGRDATATFFKAPDFIFLEVTTGEAADCLGLSEANVKVLLHRARDRLKITLLNSAAGLELFEYRAEFCDPMTAQIMAVVLEGR